MAVDPFWIAQFVRRVVTCTQARNMVIFLCGEARRLCKILDSLLLFVSSKGRTSALFKVYDSTYSSSCQSWEFHWVDGRSCILGNLLYINNHDLDSCLLAYLL